MARQRMVNPVFFQDDDIAMLSPWARLLFINLWCLADREGRLEDKPSRIRAQTFPFDPDVDAAGHLDELREQGFVIRYSVGGKKYIQVRNFLKYQHPHHREPKSTIPAWDGTSPGEAVPEPGLGTARPVESVSITESITESEVPPPPATALTTTTAALTGTAHDWNREAADDFKAVYGVNPPALFFAQVKPVAKRHGWAKTRPVLRAYMSETPIEFLNVAKCLESKVVNGHGVRGSPSPRARERVNGLNALIAGGMKGDGT